MKWSCYIVHAFIWYWLHILLLIWWMYCIEGNGCFYVCGAMKLLVYFYLRTSWRELILITYLYIILYTWYPKGHGGGYKPRTKIAIQTNVESSISWSFLVCFLVSVILDIQKYNQNNKKRKNVDWWTMKDCWTVTDWEWTEVIFSSGSLDLACIVSLWV